MNRPSRLVQHAVAFAVVLVIVLLYARPSIAQQSDFCESVSSGGFDSEFFEKHVTPLPDLDGDDFGDYAVWDPNSGFFNPRVQVFSGASHSLLYDLNGWTGDHWFGFVVVDGGDVNNDGTPDIAVGSLVASGANGDYTARITFFSGIDGTPIVRAYLVEIGPDYFEVRPFCITNVGLSGIVDGSDVAEVLAWQGASADVAGDADVDNSGVVDEYDVLQIVLSLGCNGSSFDFSDFESRLNEPELGEDEPVAGIGKIIKCFICGVKCGSKLDQAWECRNALKEAECACWELGDYFEISACLDNLRLNFLPNCLNDVIDAAGSCASCIRKCGPIPN
ncbi:MAG: hypothetical protein BroJett004_21040 [Planctomycetota bacterium]|nr:MAG: hypothetical protein BroJett004_21040 [Planctomycetota bacterium]